MKKLTLIILCLFAAGTAAAATLKMPTAPDLTIDVEGLDVPYDLPVGLCISDETKEAMHVVKTSPFDKIKYPVGAYSTDVFTRNIGKVFADVEELDSPSSTQGRVVIEVEIERFEAVIANPAYNPYTATMVYKLTVRDTAGEVLFSQAVTGDGQTSKGMMSGFKAKQLAAESAVRAMNEAATQALEALADAPELTELQSE